jgi:hypothetical protein
MGDRSAVSGEWVYNDQAIDRARYHATRAAYYLGTDGSKADPVPALYLDAARSSLGIALAALGEPVARAPTVDATPLHRRVGALEARVATLERAASIAVHGVAELDDIG